MLSLHRLYCCCELGLRSGIKLNSIKYTSALHALQSRLIYRSAQGSSSITPVNENGIIFEQPYLQQIANKGIIEIKGTDTLPYLQGLVTNDVNQLMEKDCHSIYTYLLNSQGRILYDLFIYKAQAKESEPDFYYIECDTTATADLLALLKRYKLRKKVFLSDCTAEASVYSLFGQSTSQLSDYILKLVNHKSIISAVIDPRLESLGYRSLVHADLHKSFISAFPPSVSHVHDESLYKQNLYCSGVGEGVCIYKTGKSLPLECNAAFLKAVSFSKGCYIGQELTARTHHTGVIRKRLMPVQFESASPPVCNGDTIETSSGRKVGNLVDMAGQYGIALLRVGEVIGQEHLVIKTMDDGTCRCKHSIPEWWHVQHDEIIRKSLAKAQPESNT